MHTATLIYIAPANPEWHIADVARTGSPRQGTPEFKQLLRRLIADEHWSPFEHAVASFEITTTLDVATQVLRHRSASFQMRSLRYHAAQRATAPAARMQAQGNHQTSSSEPVHPELAAWWARNAQVTMEQAYATYEEALRLGLAREVARSILPQATPTKLIMTGSVRSWIHYLGLRLHADAQPEHQQVARSIAVQLAQHLPTIAAIRGWGEGEGQ